MTSPEPFEPSLAAWLGDAPGTAPADPVSSELDRLYAAGPSPDEIQRARGRIDEALREARGVTLYYDAVGRTEVGPVFVAVSDRGVVAVDFAASEAEFVRSLRSRMGASPVRSRPMAGEAALQLRDYLAGRRLSFSLPLDLRRMSDFQRAVLLAAAEIPRGQVTTYAQLARRIGKPGAARAVGQALGHNPIPIILPCHRVLASNGSLGGYSARDGVRTKARLLRLEGAQLLAG
jgi:methylated-DNA-[protein]-cysteine S-methyltransferase